MEPLNPAKVLLLFLLLQPEVDDIAAVSMVSDH